MKATAVFVRLRILFVTLQNTNKHHLSHGFSALEVVCARLHMARPPPYVLGQENGLDDMISVMDS